MMRREPRECHIVVVLTTTMPHRRGPAGRVGGAVVKHEVTEFGWAVAADTMWHRAGYMRLNVASRRHY
jgi:hypothetical protein